MAYPQKTSREEILAAAVGQVQVGGLGSLSLRALATSLQITPNALYRYFATRSALSAAVSAENAKSLQAALENAAENRSPQDAVRGIADAYLRYARENRHMYETMVPQSHDAEDMVALERLWAFFVQSVGRVSGDEKALEAAVALWALLHGTTTLETAAVFGKEKPFSGFHYGVDAWLTYAARTQDS